MKPERKISRPANGESHRRGREDGRRGMANRTAESGVTYRQAASKPITTSVAASPTGAAVCG